MKIETIRKILARENIDSSNLENYFVEYYKSFDIQRGNPQTIPFINIQKLNAIIKLLNFVRSSFDEASFSTLVCKSIVRYSHIHCLVFIPNSYSITFQFERYATPCSPIDKSIEDLTLTNKGQVLLNDRIVM